MHSADEDDDAITRAFVAGFNAPREIQMAETAVVLHRLEAEARRRADAANRHSDLRSDLAEYEALMQFADYIAQQAVIPQMHDLECACVMCEARNPLFDALYEIEVMARKAAADGSGEAWIVSEISRIIHSISLRRAVATE